MLKIIYKNIIKINILIKKKIFLSKNYLNIILKFEKLLNFFKNYY